MEVVEGGPVTDATSKDTVSNDAIPACRRLARYLPYGYNPIIWQLEEVGDV